MIFLYCISFTIPAHADKKVDSVTIEYPNGQKTNLNYRECLFENGSILVGPDYLVNILPFPVAAKGIDWFGKEKTLSIRAVDLNVIGEKGEGFSMKINENEFKDHVLNQTFTIPQKAVMKNGHVYLPIRAISEAYGFLVDYSKSSDMTTISIHQK